MNPLNPIADLVKAVTFPFRVVFVVGLCWFINRFTSPDAHWWHWVAFGMTIALVCVWARALRTIVATVGLVGGAYLVYRWWNGRKVRTGHDLRSVESVPR